MFVDHEQVEGSDASGSDDEKKMGDCAKDDAAAGVRTQGFVWKGIVYVARPASNSRVPSAARGACDDGGR